MYLHEDVMSVRDRLYPRPELEPNQNLGSRGFGSGASLQVLPPIQKKRNFFC